MMDDQADERLRMFEHFDEESPIPDEDYGKQFPLPAPHEKSTCRCGATYDEVHFMSLPTPTDADSVWSYASSGVKLAVRNCTCKNRIARRIA